MSHNPSDTADVEPSGAAAPASNPAPEGDAADGSNVGPGPQGASAVSDILSLTDDLTKAYEGFDPATHATNPDGTPKLRKGGGFQLKRGRKPAERSPATVSQDGTVAQAQPQGAAQISNKEAAAMLCGLAEGGLIALLGDEWESEPTEARGLLKSTEAYLSATGGLDMSPGVGLMFAWGGYALPRLAKPKTQSKLKQFGAWVAGLLKRRGE